MKTRILTLTLFCGALGVFAQNVGLEPAIKTFPKEGDGASVVVTATGEWAAVSSDDWIDIKLGASGNGNGRVVYVKNGWKKTG